jgi:hypothetical protein
LVDNPGLASGSAVRLTWQDNADNESCFGVAKRIRGQLVGVIGLSPGLAGWATAPMSLEDMPDQIGLHCYQVYYGNAAGISYSEEACVDVEVLPVWRTATPTPGPATPPPAVCRGEGSYSPLGPSSPVNLRAELLGDGFTVRLTWDDQSTNEFCYVIERRVTAGDWLFHAGSGGTPSATGPGSFDDVTAQPGTHCYRMYFGNEAGRSDYSNEACVDVGAPSPTPSTTPTPTPTPSPTPTSPSGTCGGDGPPGAQGAPNPPAEFQALLSSGSDVCEGFIVRLRWKDDADNEQCYAVERKVDAGDWAFYEGGGPVDPGEDASFWVEDVPESVGAHCYRIYYGNEAGRSAYSDEQCVQVEVVPRVVTSTPLFSPTPTPTRPPGCDFERQVGSPRAPDAPTNLRVALRDEPGLPQPSFVDFTWDDNSTDEACFVLTYEGSSRMTDVTGQNQAAFSKAAYAERCGMAGYWCYRVSAANEWGMSQPSNEVCLSIEPKAVSTPAATPGAAQGAAVSDLPTASGATGSGGAAWWWWALAGGGVALLGLSAVTLVRAAGGKR